MRWAVISAVLVVLLGVETMPVHAATLYDPMMEGKGTPFPPRGIDPEGIVLARPGFLYISSEGATNAEPPLDPFANRFNLNGRQTRALAIPDKFLPNNVEGRNLGPLLPDGRRTLILVSDNNFNPAQETQFIALVVSL